jgi:hypothetical protein
MGVVTRIRIEICTKYTGVELESSSMIYHRVGNPKVNSSTPTRTEMTSPGHNFCTYTRHPRSKACGPQTSINTYTGSSAMGERETSAERKGESQNMHPVLTYPRAFIGHPHGRALRMYVCLMLLVDACLQLGTGRKA